MKKLAIKDIVIQQQIRESFGNLDDLAFSLNRYGQLQPIIVDKNNVLIAGERRIRAAEKLGWTELNAVEYDTVDEVTKKELQLEENIRRKQLNWDEEIRAIREVHLLKQQQYGKAVAGRFSSSSKGWGVRDTAKELNMSTGLVSESLNLADALDKYPELSKVASKREAKRQFRKLSSFDPEIDTETLSAKLSEMYITDYDIGAMPNGIIHLLMMDVAGLTPQKEFDKILPKLAIVGHGFVFFTPEQLPEIALYLRTHKMSYTPEPFVWHIKSSDDYIPFMWFSKNLAEPPANLRKVYGFKRNDNYLHSREKSVELLHHLIAQCTGKGSLVFDMHAYSGLTAFLCYQYNRNCVAICNVVHMYEESMKRIIDYVRTK